MIVHGYHTELKETYDNAHFPVILLTPDLNVSYMNTEAKHSFGRFFKLPIWYSRYIEKDVLEKTRSLLEKGESVILTPPNVKEISMLLFQPISDNNGKTVYIRMSADIFGGLKQDYDSLKNFKNVYDTMYERIKGTVNTLQMSVESIKDDKKGLLSISYLKSINKKLSDLNGFIMNSEYIFELINKHNLKTDSIFNPIETVDKIIKTYPNAEITESIGNTSEIILEKAGFSYAIDLIMNYIYVLSPDGKIKLKTEEQHNHLVFVFETKLTVSKLPSPQLLGEFDLKMDILKRMSEKIGGNLLILNTGRKLKVLYSLKKLIRSEYSAVFRQGE